MSGLRLRSIGVQSMSNLSSTANAAAADPALKYKYDSSDPAVGADPVPYYKSLLAAPPIIVERRGVPWAIVSRYRDSVEVLRDFKRFSSVNPNLPGTEDFDAFRGVPVMTFVDPPIHTRLHGNPLFVVPRPRQSRSIT